MILYAIVAIFGSPVTRATVTAGIRIEGEVRTVEGNPVSGADVFIRTTSIYTVSDKDGQFMLESDNGAIPVSRKLSAESRIERGVRLEKSGAVIKVHNAERQALNLKIFDLRGRNLGRFRVTKKMAVISLDALSGSYLLEIRGENGDIARAAISVMGGQVLSIGRMKSAATRSRELKGHATATELSQNAYELIAAKDGTASEPVSVEMDTTDGIVLTLTENKTYRTPADYVNPFIATSGDHGQLFPGAVVPWGMVKLSPDNAGHSGYNYKLDWIRGFSHTRVGGVGCRGAGGSVLVVPGVGKIHETIFVDKDSEHAEAGYYRIDFRDEEVTAEMTVSPNGRTGLHRYHFPATDSALLWFNPAHSFAKDGSGEVEVVGEGEIAGTVRAKNVCNEGLYTIHFNAKFSQPFHNQSGDTLHFSIQEGKPLLAKITLSPISRQQAAVDRDAELSHWDFDHVRDQARNRWNSVLSRIQIEGGNEEYKELFYTLLYRSYLTPVMATSTSDTYQGTDGVEHDSEGREHFNSWSIWDTFRSKFMVLSITEPRRLQDMVHSLASLQRREKELGDDQRTLSDRAHRAYAGSDCRRLSERTH